MRAAAATFLWALAAAVLGAVVAGEGRRRTRAACRLCLLLARCLAPGAAALVGAVVVVQQERALALSHPRWRLALAPHPAWGVSLTVTVAARSQGLQVAAGRH